METKRKLEYDREAMLKYTEDISLVLEDLKKRDRHKTLTGFTLLTSLRSVAHKSNLLHRRIMQEENIRGMKI